MIELQTNLEKFTNELADVAKLFDAQEGVMQIVHMADDGTLWRDCFEVSAFGAQARRVFEQQPCGRDALDVVRRRKRMCKMGLYEVLKALSGYDPPWGALTGIRPTRLLYEAIEGGLSPDEAMAQVVREFDVSPQKARMLRQIYDMQRGLYARDDSLYDVYVGIPFCPTRCSYCSFSATDLKRGQKLVPDYLSALEKEMNACAQDMQTLGLSPRAIYFGGGTPTALSAGELDALLSLARACFPGARELTVEAGRPDSITREKLAAIKAARADRISINPQTMNDETLARIGRHHSAQAIADAFELARSMGFDNINADIIAALPSEGPEEFARTLTQIDALSPESLTVHTLALKHASQLHLQSYVQTDAHTATAMVQAASDYAAGAGYLPYYMYRQKYMAGNLENVGYCRPGRQCLYNIDIMEETTHILALGAGGISKWLFGGRDLRIERSANLKNVELYIRGVDEMIARKRALYFKK